jgi:hypothetical protein
MYSFGSTSSDGLRLDVSRRRSKSKCALGPARNVGLLQLQCALRKFREQPWER